MDTITKRIISSVVVLFCFFTVFNLQAGQKGSFVTHKWVVKLKQNSFFNRRPFQFASPVFKNGKIFVGVAQEIFYGIDGKRGKKLWKFQTGSPVYAQAAADETAVYFADMEGVVYALDQNTGKPIWMTKAGGPIMSAPLVVGDKLYVVSLLKELVCLDLKAGKILWEESFGTRDSGFTIQGSADPVLFDSLILVGYSDGTLVAHHAADGSIAWTKQLGDRLNEFHDVDSTPFVVSSAEGTLAYVSSTDGKLFALNPENGKTAWQAEAGGVNNAFVSDSFLYTTQGGKVSCFEAKTGNILWEQSLEVPEFSSPIVYKDWVVVSATKGKTYFLDKKGGDVLYSWYVRGGSYGDPVLADNQIYLLSNASRLYDFQFTRK